MSIIFNKILYQYYTLPYICIMTFGRLDAIVLYHFHSIIGSEAHIIYVLQLYILEFTLQYYV